MKKLFRLERLQRRFRPKCCTDFTQHYILIWRRMDYSNRIRRFFIAACLEWTPVCPIPCSLGEAAERRCGGMQATYLQISRLLEKNIGRSYLAYIRGKVVAAMQEAGMQQRWESNSLRRKFTFQQQTHSMSFVLWRRSSQKKLIIHSKSKIWNLFMIVIASLTCTRVTEFLVYRLPCS